MAILKFDSVRLPTVDEQVPQTMDLDDATHLTHSIKILLRKQKVSLNEPGEKIQQRTLMRLRWAARFAMGLFIVEAIVIVLFFLLILIHLLF